MGYGFHNHQRHSRPDEKMGREDHKDYAGHFTSAQRKVMKSLAARKRRQRDKVKP